MSHAAIGPAAPRTVLLLVVVLVVVVVVLAVVVVVGLVAVVVAAVLLLVVVPAVVAVVVAVVVVVVVVVIMHHDPPTVSLIYIGVAHDLASHARHGEHSQPLVWKRVACTHAGCELTIVRIKDTWRLAWRLA